MYEGGDYNNFDDAYSWNMEPISKTNTATEHKTSESAANALNTTERKKKYTKRASTPHSKKVSPYSPLFYYKTLANPDHET